MSLRRLSTAASTALLCGANNGGVLAALCVEISHELSSSPSSESSPPFPPFPGQGILDFVTVLDAPRAQDMLLHRRSASEEVLVSALLAPLRFEGEEPLPRDALTKVFISNPGVTPVLRFDYRAFALLTMLLLLFGTTRFLATLERTSMKGRSSEIWILSYRLR